MTYIKEIFTDALTLDSVKAHLNVTFDDDNGLIESYQKASLLFLEKSTNRYLRPLKFIADESELIPIINHNEQFFQLSLPYRPEEVVVDSVSYNDIDDFYSYDCTNKILYIPYTQPVTEIHVITGASNVSLIDLELINQARLMLIANWYAFRESDITTTINEVPNGVKRIIDLISGSLI